LELLAALQQQLIRPSNVGFTEFGIGLDCHSDRQLEPPWQLDLSSRFSSDRIISGHGLRSNSFSPGVASRLVPLDLFRGVTIAAMILVNDPGNDQAFGPLKHSEWNGWTLTDLIFPFFHRRRLSGSFDRIAGGTGRLQSSARPSRPPPRGGR
jgi:hypothetical protein